MHVISSKTHGMLDFIVGFFLIVAPLLMGSLYKGQAIWAPVILGVATLVYSAFTNYELGRFKILSMRTHLVIDVIAALLLGASPWLFNFHDEIYLPYLIVALLEIIIILLSNPVAFNSKTIEAGNRVSRPAHSQ
jgi:hypothetical protein